MTDNQTVDDDNSALANVNRQAEIANPRGKLPPVDWQRGNKPTWEKRIAESWRARSLASGGTTGG